jgi:undecaprenyl diphosphate synthase
MLGNLSYLPEDIQELISRAERLTEKNEEALLNVAFSYTSRYRYLTTTGMF